MDEDQRYERFEDNDFEEGTWIGGEYFYTSAKKRRVQTKDEQLYGYESDASDDDRRRGRGRGGGKKAADYTRPVGFVSSGVVKSTDEKAQDVEAAEHAPAGLGAPSSTPGRPQNGGGGLGFSGASASGGSGGGLGFARAKELHVDPDGAEDADVLPTSFGKSIKEAAAERARRQRERQRSEKAASTSNGGSGRAPAPAGADIGTFERHTKGIGAKLMASMGYTPGEGLGRNRQGISKPIEAKLRPKGMGMGYNDYSEHKLVMPEEEKKAAAATAAAAAEGAAAGPGKAKEAAVDVRLWRKRHAAARVRREFRTAEEVLNEAAEQPAAAPKQTILDMRGPQARLVTNLEHLNVDADDASFGEGALPMPELQHNLRLLVDLAEADIARTDGRLRQEKDTAVILGREQARLREELDTARARVERASHVLQEVARCQATDARSSLAQVAVAYSGLRVSYREEYVLYNLAAAALAQVLPRLGALLSDWAPLEDPQRGRAEFAAWRPLLESDAQREAIFQDVAPAASEDPYTRLLAAAVLPKLANALTNAWEPRDPEPPLRFLEAWAELLPAGVQRHILDSLILPKLTRAVAGWEPRQERVPLHAWLHPWLEALGPGLEGLYPGIRFKLASALQAWHPSDASALALLSPWHKVFEPKEWAALTGRSILPKLAYTLDAEFAVNPVAQDLQPWQWVVAWAPVLPRQQLASLLEDHFFPKWHAVLRHWLAHAPDYDEVTAWYLGWKGMLPAEVQDSERIRAHLNSALNAMNAAVEGVPLQYAQPGGGQQAGAGAGYSYAGGAGAAAAAAAGGYGEAGGYGAAAPATGAPSAAEPTMRQLVEQYAADAGVEFLPKAGRRHEGLQVYGFGGVSCVVDSSASVVRAHIGGAWVLASLEQLLAEARKRQRL